MPHSRPARFKAHSHIPCRVAKKLDCVFPISVTQSDRVYSHINAVLR